MLACTRIGAVHSVVFGGFSSDALRDRILDAEARVVVTADGGWRRGQGVGLKGNVDVAVAETPCVDHVVVVERTGRRHGGRSRGHDRRTGPLVARAHDGRGPGGRRPPRRQLRAGAHGGRGPAVHPLHLGHHGRPQGHHAHHRRLPHPGGLHPQGRLRPPPRRGRVLVRGRHRLGDRPQLHRLRAAGQRGHVGDVRGDARHAGPRPVVVDRRALRRDHPLLRAHGHPDVHEVGARGAGPARPVQPAAARLGRRAHQPRGVDVVRRPTSAAAAARWSTPGGRPRPAPS